MFPNPPVLGPPIETEEQAKNWVMDLVGELERIRTECDLVMVNNGANRGSARMARQLFIHWLMKRGESLGVLQASKRFGKISDETYTALRERILATQMPTLLVMPETSRMGG